MEKYKNVVEEGWAEFLTELREYERRSLIAEKENLLLDAYSSWLKSKEEKYKFQVLNFAHELNRLGVFINLEKLFPEEK